MHPTLFVGYHGAGFDSPAYKLSVQYGDCLEQITCGDKLALVAVLCGWLAEDDETYDLVSAMVDCNMVASPKFSDYIEALNGITPNDALALCQALMAQVVSGVYLR